MYSVGLTRLQAPDSPGAHPGHCRAVARTALVRQNTRLVSHRRRHAQSRARLGRHSTLEEHRYPAISRMREATTPLTRAGTATDIRYPATVEVQKDGSFLVQLVGLPDTFIQALRWRTLPSCHGKQVPRIGHPTSWSLKTNFPKTSRTEASTSLSRTRMISISGRTWF